MVVSIDCIVDGLRELSLSKDRQEVLWVKGIRDEIHSFEEAISYIFDDSGLGMALDKNEEESYLPYLKVDSINLLKKHINKIPYENLSPDEIINHSEMENIRKIALGILSDINNT